MLTSIIEIVKECFFEVVHAILVLIPLFVIAFLCIRLERWYKRAKIRREKRDGKQVIEYIRNNDSMPNGIQRIIQKYTGIIFTKETAESIFCFIIGVGITSGIVLFIYYVAKYFGLTEFVISILGNHIISILMYISIFLLGVVALILEIVTIIELVKYARFIPFIFLNACIIIYVYVALFL